MATLWKFISSSVGTKVIIALSGLALVGYLVLHLAGNLFIFLGPASLNGWGHTLISNPLVIPAEIGLAIIFLIHVTKSVLMWWENRRARPVGYDEKRWAGHTSRKTFSSTTMIWTGLVIFTFVVIHVAAFKYGAFYEPPEFEPGVRDLYQLVVGTFLNPGWALFYVAVIALVGLHLWHAVSSAFQSLGADGPRFTPFILRAGIIVALGLGAGFAFIPIWVYFLR
jgi:succinate dehydrogenase / fumarate reductase, cytochrome b subunit